MWQVRPLRPWFVDSIPWAPLAKEWILKWFSPMEFLGMRCQRLHFINSTFFANLAYWRWITWSCDCFGISEVARYFVTSRNSPLTTQSHNLAIPTMNKDIHWWGNHGFYRFHQKWRWGLWHLFRKLFVVLIKVSFDETKYHLII